MTLTAAFNHFNFFRQATAHAAGVSAPNYIADYEANSPYKILGVRRNAGDEEIKRAWRKLLMANHPDLGGDVTKTMTINNAYRDICHRRGL